MSGMTLHTFTVLGDSNTSGQSVDLPTGLANGRSWALQPIADGHTLVGGLAFSGYTSVGLRNRAVPVDAEYLYFQLGTNDLPKLYWEPTDPEPTKTALIEAAEIVAADHVIAGAIPPWNDPLYDGLTLQFNVWLKALAAQKGWLFFDPWEPTAVGEIDFRTAGGQWTSAARTAGFVNDAKHASVSGYAEMGGRVSRFLSTLP